MGGSESSQNVSAFPLGVSAKADAVINRKEETLAPDVHHMTPKQRRWWFAHLVDEKSGVSVHREEQEIHHKVTKDTKVRVLFFLVSLCLGGERISLAFGQENTSTEKAPRNQGQVSVALWSCLPAPVLRGGGIPLNPYLCFSALYSLDERAIPIYPRLEKRYDR